MGFQLTKMPVHPPFPSNPQKGQEEYGTTGSLVSTTRSEANEELWVS